MACGWRALQNPKYVPAKVTNTLPIHFDKSGVLLKTPLQHTCICSSSKKTQLPCAYALGKCDFNGTTISPFGLLVHYNFGLSVVLVQILFKSLSCVLLGELLRDTEALPA